MGSLNYLRVSSAPFSSVTQSRLTFCDPMNCSTPGLPVHHQLPEFTQVRDAIQPSHLLSSSSPPALNPSQHQSLFQWVNSCMRWPKYWSFSFSIIPSKEHPGLISFEMPKFEVLGMWNTLLFCELVYLLRPLAWPETIYFLDLSVY